MIYVLLIGKSDHVDLNWSKSLLIGVLFTGPKCLVGIIGIKSLNVFSSEQIPR